MISWRLRFLIWLIGILPRGLAIRLGLRRITPPPGWRGAGYSWNVARLDTGGAFRAAFRQQNPSVDPKEPYGSESSSTGTDHGWSNCTMSAGAMGLAYEQPNGSLAPWGGDLRHRQSDMSGGTDLYDLRTAWAAFGKTLTIKSGAGWSALVADHDAGRAIVVQGTGNVPGSSSFGDPHACVISPETHSNGSWLFGDPNTTGWQWVSPSSIKTWMSAFSSGYAFAVGAKPPAPKPPEPEPAPPKPPPPPEPSYTIEEIRPLLSIATTRAVTIAGDELVGLWVDYLEAPTPAPGDVWDAGAWADTNDVLAAMRRLWYQELEPDPCAPGQPAAWHRGPVPMPLGDALEAIETPALWGLTSWRAGLWRE